MERFQKMLGQHYDHPSSHLRAICKIKSGLEFRRFRGIRIIGKPGAGQEKERDGC